MTACRISRRHMLGMLGGIGAAGSLGALGALGALGIDGVFSPAAAREALFVGARADADGAFSLAGFDGEGRERFSVPLPARGHGIARRPGHADVVLFARRPGTFALVVDTRSGDAVTGFETPPERHFYGHGVFSRDGRLLYATENDFGGERGAVGIYDAEAGYRRIGEIDSHGIGPHELCLLGDGVTLAIANGGILTHPDLPRAKLNLAEMEPSLALVDRRDGALLERFTLPRELHQLSIRHLHVCDRHVTRQCDDKIAIAMQYQGPGGDNVPLVATCDGRALKTHFAPEELQPRLHNYCGSVVFDAAGGRFAVSAPRGNLITLWRADGTFLRALDLADGCAIAQSGQGFIATGGTGRAIRFGAGPDADVDAPFLAESAWDNHMIAL